MPSNKNKNLNPNDSIPQMYVVALVGASVMVARKLRIQFIVPECMLFVLLNEEKLGLSGLLTNKYGVDVDSLLEDIVAYLDSLERVPERKQYTPRPSSAYDSLSAKVANLSGSGDMADVYPSHFFQAMTMLKGTEAKRLLDLYIPASKLKNVISDFEVICHNSKSYELDGVPDFMSDMFDEGNGLGGDFHDQYGSQGRDPMSEPAVDEACYRIDTDPEYAEACFEGRADEIKRSLLTLLKGSKSNLVFVGERGVGKTSMIKGLIKAKSFYSKKSRIGGAHFYKFTPSAIVTGVSYADEIENHVAQIVDDIEKEKCMAILFADNMAELMPQHQNDNTPDTLRLLTSLIEDKDIHIITTASFEQYKRLSSNSQTLNKFFTRIDIAEPPIEPDARLMFKSAARSVLKLHQCIPYDDNFLPHVFEMAVSSYTKDIAMPGRAIDLLDSVGASLELENSELRSKRKTKEEPAHGEAVPAAVDRLLKKLGYDTIATAAGNEARLRDLEPNLLKKIFGQDEAVHGVSESVLLAKAGLSDDTKPLAAYLFVGPTGVGKTELAKVLATELGTKLVRFDMSEYSEQHTVSKLVGSPAGYIGYDDGGLLTDAVRKTPNCVLLFDEIEKAHSAVFNLLLQVLDYAQLTDNKGQKADFSGAIIIMTSNAGARFATGRGLGFGSNKEKSEVMGSELKRVFAPEFLNRLTQIVAFHDMSKEMAERILDRKVAELKSILEKKRKVTFSLTPEARQVLLDAGFSSTYGAREMDRAIGRLLKPALMQALLFRDGVKSGASLAVRVESQDKLIAE